MTPEQALEILRNATGTIQANREAHITISAALDVLAKALEPAKK